MQQRDPGVIRGETDDADRLVVDDGEKKRGRRIDAVPRDGVIDPLALAPHGQGEQAGDGGIIVVRAITSMAASPPA